MPIQAPSWTEFLYCPICCNEFSTTERLPISLGCGHTICRLCLGSIHNRQCPYDQTTITINIDNLPINNALLQLLDNDKINNYTTSNNDIYNNVKGTENMPPSVLSLSPENLKNYHLAKNCIESLALHLKSFLTGNYGSVLSRPMQRKVVTLVNCQLMEEEGRIRALRAARLLGERTVTELILHHQNPQQLSINLWAAVRSRGCQFLGPSMQEEVLKLVLLVLEDGSALSRKVLVLFVVQRLEKKFPQASKTSIGHVVQLLYRASCFKVSKREADSSLMQLKEEFRTYDALRREHDAQIVQIATEAGLRIAPDQWSALLYGDVLHKSHMQSIIDKLQSPSSFAQSVQELVIALQRTGDPAKLAGLHDQLKHLAGIDPSLESITPTWGEVAKALDAVREVVIGLVDFLRHHGSRKLQDNSVQGNSSVKYKISLCRDHAVRRICPRGSSCTFAHSEEERERYRAKNRKNPNAIIINDNICGQNNTSSQKEYHLRHTSLHSPDTVMLYPIDETASSTSTTNSPLRLSSSIQGKQSRNTFGDITPSHLHVSILEQCPMPKGNMISGVCSSIPLSIQPTHHRYETSFGHLNCGMQSTILATNGVSPPMLPIHNPNTELQSSGTFATTSQQSNVIPINNLNATINPPKPTNNNLIASGASSKNMNINNNIYNYFDNNLPSGHTPLISGQGNEKVYNQHVSHQFNLGQTTTSMWQQNQLNIAVLKNSSLMYDAAAKPFFEKTQFQPSQKQSRFTFKSSLNNNTNNNISGIQSNVANTVGDIYKDNEFVCNMHKSSRSYWGLHNTVGVHSVDDDVLLGQSQTGTQNTVLNSSVFNDRDNFVRSDSILDDDATSCDVSDVAKTVENKFGPIRPMQKTITSSNFLTLSSVDDSLTHQLVQSRNLPHSPTPIEQVETTCNTFNNFGNLQEELPNLSVIDLNFNNSNANNSISKNETLFDTDDNNKFVCSLNTLMTMGDVNHSNNLDLNQNLSISDGLLWSKNSGRDRNGGVTVNIMHEQPYISDLKSSNCWYTPTHSMLTPTTATKNHNHTDDENPQQLEIPRKSQQQNIDIGINSSMMRDIENELAEIVDKV